MNHSLQTTLSSSLPSDQRPTPDEILDLPMAELLTRTDCSLDSTTINERGFFGYVDVDATNHATVYSPDQLGDNVRDASIRYLVAKRLGIAVPALDALFNCTVYTRADLEAALA